jgi:membrane associated rhomboid family serine protease
MVIQWDYVHFKFSDRHVLRRSPFIKHGFLHLLLPHIILKMESLWRTSIYVYIHKME